MSYTGHFFQNSDSRPCEVHVDANRREKRQKRRRQGRHRVQAQRREPPIDAAATRRRRQHCRRPSVDGELRRHVARRQRLFDGQDFETRRLKLRTFLEVDRHPEQGLKVSLHLGEG